MGVGVGVGVGVDYLLLVGVGVERGGMYCTQHFLPEKVNGTMRPRESKNKRKPWRIE